MAVQALLSRIQGPTAHAGACHSTRSEAAQPRSARVAIGVSATEHSGFQRRYRQLLLRPRATEGAISGVEPDLPEDFDYVPDSEWMTAFEDREADEFAYGKADGHHVWHKGDDNVELIDSVTEMIKDAGGPNDHLGQAVISWLFIPAMICGFAFNVQQDYLFLGATLYIFAFIGIEMAKPERSTDAKP